ncbi:flagellar hook-associated protein 3 [Granulicella sp. dw_53]|uniref:flagellin N-terminal helical domain-containing protein n=1 Tax=Granulicella sp. dw_53 TaxID=2719792 RepID=UPI001BD26DE9|nr:flagellar hook-associated protein 3 [Granulicella sp. dw_53]
MQFNPNYLSQLASSVSQSTALENYLAEELSSGLRVTSLEVDPVAAAISSRIASSMAKDDSYIQASTNEQSMLNVTDSTLGEVVTQLTSAIALAVGGNSGTLSASDMQGIASKLSSIRDQVLSLANTSYLGSNLFGGSQGSTPPFSLDTSTNPATVSYQGDTNVQQIATPTGQKIQLNLPGSTIFGSTGSGVFAALNQLISDFSSGTPSSTATTDVSALTDAMHQVSLQRSVLDNSLNQLQSTSQYAQTDKVQLTVQQSSLISSDPTTIATQLKSAETQHEALLSVIATLGSTNLFSYLR